MTDAHKRTEAADTDSVQPTAVGAVINPAMTPMNDAAGGPMADKEQMDEPSDKEAAAQLGGLS